MSQGGSSLKAVLFALGANGGIAASKFGAALYTGSGAMLAEAIHSTADCANQVLLLLGMREAKRDESDDHPLGYHRASYYYAMLVALLLFFMGGAFSVYEGIERLQHAEPLQSPLVALAVLGIGLALESASLFGAMREINKNRGGKSFLQWFRETRESELMVVAGEDIAALMGADAGVLRRRPDGRDRQPDLRRHRFDRSRCFADHRRRDGDARGQGDDRRRIGFARSAHGDRSAFAGRVPRSSRSCA